MRPRITFVTSALGIGGAERHWATLLPALADRGLDVRVLTLIGEGQFYDQLRTAGIAVSCAHMRSRTDLRGLRRAFDLFDHGTDLVVSQSVNAQVIGALMALSARVPHVTIDQGGPGVALRFHQRLLVRAVARSAVRLIAVSPAQIDRLVGFGFRSAQIEVIPNGIEHLEPNMSREAVRRSLDAGEDAFVALLVAELRPVKEVHVFVEAVALAHARNPRVLGFVVGSGPEYARVAEAASRSNGAVRLLGARFDIPDLMAAADVICLSSATEAIPLVLLEAMSLGQPVVSTDVGGVDRVVVDGETGILVQPRDSEAFAQAILRLAADVALRSRLGAAGQRRQRERFDIEVTADAYATTLQSVLQSRQSRQRSGAP